jgi:hypothetical protein
VENFLDQTPNIDLISSHLGDQLGGEWSVTSFWKFENLTVDIIATHPAKGLAIFRVITLPDEFLLPELERELEKLGSRNEESGSPITYSFEDVGLLADPREQIDFWRDQVQQLLESSAPNEYKQYLSFGLIIFQSGSNAQKNLEYLKKQTHYAQNVRIRTELIQNDAALTGIANRLIPANGGIGEKRMPSKMWMKIQVTILGDPTLIIEQLPPPMNDFDSDQIRFIQRVVTNRYSRLNGPAGSGKTTVVARLVADAVLRDERVLVVSRNKSICPLIKARVRRYVIDTAKNKEEQHELIRKTDLSTTITHQEAWWKLIFAESGYLKESNRQYARDIESIENFKSNEDGRKTEEHQLELLIKALQKLERVSRKSFVFDLVVIDEAQNILVENWNAMKMTLKSDVSRAVIVADHSQSLYGDRPWTDTRMPGFSGAWSRLSGSHRIPSNCVTLIHEFAQTFPPGDDVVLPEMPMQDDLFFPDANLWHMEAGNTANGWQANLIARCVIYMRDIEMYQPYEIAFLVGSNPRGFKVVRNLLEFDANIETTTSFNKATRSELGFGLGVRGSTVHSFAGWESPCLIIDLDVPEILESPNAIVYSALTRIRKRMAGSSLVFVCGEDRYSEFFRKRTKKLDV